MSSDRSYSGGAVGLTVFASTMMIIGGIWSAIIGFAGLVENEFWTVVPALGTAESGDAYVMAFDVTTWGWIHLILGIIVLLAGIALLQGAVWARTVGVIIASISALVNFIWLPWYPVWAIVVITLDIFIIWALTAHGRDVTRVPD